MSDGARKGIEQLINGLRDCQNGYNEMLVNFEKSADKFKCNETSEAIDYRGSIKNMTQHRDELSQQIQQLEETLKTI